MSSSGLSREKDSPPQGPPTAISYSGSSSDGLISAGLDSLLMCDEARLALEHVVSLSLAYSGFKTELLHSRNIADSDTDYIPNIFDHHSENLVPEVRQIPPTRWFVAYYRNGCGNFIHASRYLAKEIGTIPEGNLKKYGNGVLVQAKDIMQARMLQHLHTLLTACFKP
ncbi:hypothetical protein E2C01_054460 [Portunus trituberculatus]|uniref:Uncharacterized protein n=1 Tax=Portunus trituberculatus TaxID=210409 RepID=A0A5B7GT96_PORTR|nr:hypothetical protein [Portunus trituberculatus]